MSIYADSLDREIHDAPIVNTLAELFYRLNGGTLPWSEVDEADRNHYGTMADFAVYHVRIVDEVRRGAAA